MKKLLFMGIILGSSLTLFGQKENSTKCSKVYKNVGQQKSSSLNVNQIAESEKYDVTFYKLDIEMSNLSTDVAGTGTIEGKAVETLDSVLFELFSTFNISEIRLDGSPVNYSRVNSAIKVPVNLAIGQTFSIEVDYDGTPPTQATNPLGGYGMTNDSSPSWGNQVTWSLSESFGAYEWWPCKQSLTDKADSVQMHITVPSNCKAGSNGVLENEVNLGNGYTRFEWMHRHPIDYYLVSVAVAEYVEYNVYANPAGAPAPILIQNYIYNNPNTLPYFQNDIDETVDFIELFADLYGPYPFQDEKYGHCMAPLSGGMEHQTMTTQGWFEKELTAHELGHQWWGDNVTCASWTDIWVNEGFASYSEYLMLEHLYPSEKAQKMNDLHSNVMSTNNGSVWVLDSLNENRIFSSRLTYDKGGAIVHTLRYMINDDDLFFSTLQNFQNDFKDGTATGLDIRDYFMTKTGVDLTAFFNEWYFGEGYPTYNVKWNSDGSKVILNITHTTSSSTPTFTNPIDIRMLRSGMSDTIVRVNINSNNEFIELNDLSNVTSVIQVDPNNWVINKLSGLSQDASLSIIENESEEIFKVFPNPTNGKVNIETNYGEQEAIVYDINGKIVLKHQFTNSCTLDLSEVNKGYYIIHLLDENQNKRIVTVAKQ